MDLVKIRRVPVLEDGHDMAKLPRRRNDVPLEHEIDEEEQAGAPPRKVGLKRAVRESVLSWCGIMAESVSALENSDAENGASKSPEE